MVELLRPRRLADQIYEALLEMISADDFQEGTRLPSESALAQSLKVSRPVVREALTRLRGDGVVTSRQGSGSYVHRVPNKALFRFAPQGSIAGLMRAFEFRIGLECAGVELAAMRRTKKHIAAMEEAFAELERINARGETGAREDVILHRTIISAAGNDLYLDAITMLDANMTKAIETARRLSIGKSDQRLRIVQNEHRRIIDAVIAGDPNEARAAMHRHLRNARDRVLTERGYQGDGSPA